MKYEIKNRFTGAVQFTAEIEADDNTYWRVKIGLALKWAIESGADLSSAVLSGADLRDADLSSADLRGAVLRGYKIQKVITRVTRNDGYEFIGFESDKGLLIRAGCRTMLVEQYRQHITKEYPATAKAEETTAILDFIESRARVLCVQTKTSEGAL